MSQIDPILKQIASEDTGRYIKILLKNGLHASGKVVPLEEFLVATKWSVFNKKEEFPHLKGDSTVAQDPNFADYIHLGNAKLIGSVVLTKHEDGVYYRFKLTEIDAFSLGYK